MAPHDGPKDDTTELRAALEAHLQRIAPRPMVLVDFLVVAQTVGFDEDGNDVDSTTIVPVDGPTSRSLGLLDEARIRFQAEVLASYGDAIE